MSTPIRFFGEGKADKRFLEDFVKHHFGISKIDYINVNGKDSIELVAPQFKINTEQGGVNLLIFDSDSDYQQALDNVNKQKDDCGIQFETFLFPNNADTGALEKLLLQMTVPEHQGIFDCFKPFNECLLGHNPGYNVPDLKIQIYSYLTFQSLEGKDPVRDYTLPCWNLDAEYAQPLKAFIGKHLLL